MPIRSVLKTSSRLDYKKRCIDDETIKVLDGLLLSDGSIADVSGKYHRFSMGSSSKEFVDYCFTKLKPVCLSEGPKQYTSKNAEYKNGRQATWDFSTGTHPDFTFQYNRWYKEGVKIIPKDVSVSPTALLLWYYGDGTLINSADGNSCSVRLATDAFTPEDIDMFIEKIKSESKRNRGAYSK